MVAADVAAHKVYALNAIQDSMAPAVAHKNKHRLRLVCPLAAMIVVAECPKPWVFVHLGGVGFGSRVSETEIVREAMA